ncbi:MAG TPA: M48 family metallopeptidase [Candidatus Limnocylindrales bacterium]|nr:M48 family metallopeptidase [Candidatus Limnocylindrales bacterium]
MGPGPGAHVSFYDEIAENRRDSIVLVVIVAAVLGVLGFAIGYGVSGELATGWIVLGLALVLAFVLSVGSYFGGDSLVLSASQARQVDESSAPQLLNVVRELTLAAGLPMPKVYIIDDSAPNAFATGRDPEHASVAITTGLLDKLDREELQGVFGHELSHVRNYDIRFALLVAVLVGSVALIGDFFLRFTFWGGGPRRRDDRSGGGGGGQAIVFIIAIALAILAPIFATFVQLAISREREYLADASSVALTRNPRGLEQALAKIASDKEVLEVANRATQHLYIVNPIKKFEARASGLMATHPPIIDRINRLRALSGDPPLDAASAAALQGLD